jgi:hypothetical protein
VFKMQFKEWMKSASKFEIEAFLDYCYDNNQAPSTSVLKIFQDTEERARKIYNVATKLDPQTVGNALTHLDKMIDQIQSWDQSGDSGFDMITEEVKEARNFLNGLIEGYGGYGG